MTARLAVEIKHLPDWEVDWNDTTPQVDPATVTISDLLSTEADGSILHKRAVQHIMQFLVTEFRCLNCLAFLLPTAITSHNTSQSKVVPMKILFKYEKYKAQTTDILTQLAADAQLSGKSEVIYNAEIYPLRDKPPIFAYSSYRF